MIKVAVFDIDGTLVQYPEYDIPQSAVVAVEKLRQNGIKVVIATARGRCEIEDWVINQIKPDYFIIGNGQGILDKDLNPIEISYIPNEVIDRFAKLSRERDFNLSLKFLDFCGVYNGVFENSRTFHGAKWIEDRTMTTHYQYPCTGLLVTWIQHPEKAVDNLEELFPELQIYGLGKSVGCDIASKGTSKLIGLKKLLSILGNTLDECIGFGDSRNDNEILEAEGISVCMGNGSKETKDIVDYVTDDIHNDGIYKALIHFQLIKEEQ